MALLNTLTDDFNDNSINGTKWGTSVVGTGTVQETSQRLVISSSNTTGTRTSSLYSQSSYDFHGSTLVVEVPSLTLGGSASAYATIDDPVLLAMIMEMRVTGGDLELRVGVSGTVHSVTYNSTNHRWWRMRESAGTCYFDVSPDGNSWTNLYSYSNSVDISNVRVTFLGAANAGLSYSFQIDNVNLGFDIGLVIADALHGHSLEAVEVDTQSAPLVGAFFSSGLFGGSFPGSTYWASSPQILITLELADLHHSQLLDAVTLAVKSYLDPNDLSHAHALDAVIITQKHNITAADLLHDHTLDAVTITEHKTLEIDDLYHDHTLDNVLVSSEGSVAPDDLDHSHLLDSVDLIQKHTLEIDDLSHSHTLDNVDLVQKQTLVINDLYHDHILDGDLILSQKHLLAVSDLLHSHTLDSIVLTQKHILAIQDALHDHTLDAVVVVTGTAIEIDDMRHIHILDPTAILVLLKPKPQPPDVTPDNPGIDLQRDDVFGGTDNDRVDITAHEDLPQVAIVSDKPDGIDAEP